jgi:hypothetical protein
LIISALDETIAAALASCVIYPKFLEHLKLQEHLDLSTHQSIGLFVCLQRSRLNFLIANSLGYLKHLIC